MSYPDKKYYITFFFQLYKDFEMSIKSNDNKSKVRPKSYADSSFIVFFAIMELRGINRFKAQHLFLLTHQEKVSSLCSKVSLIGRPYPVAINN